MKKLNLLAVAMLFIQLQTSAQQEKQSDVAFGYQTLKGNVVNLANSKYESANYSDLKDYAYYLQKKKNNLTAGLVTLGAGLAFSGIGLITASNSSNIDSDVTAAVFLIVGAASGIASIPLMVMANVYGHKAKISLSNQKTGFGLPSRADKNIAGLTISIPFGK